MTARNYRAESEARKRSKGLIKGSIWHPDTEEARARVKRLERALLKEHEAKDRG